MNAIKDWFLKNKVFIIGLLGSIGLVLQQYIGEVTPDLKIVGFAALTAALSFLANQWRGSNVTILGVLGSLSATLATVLGSGNHVTIQQLILTLVVSILSAVASPPKSAGYEKTAMIEEAKAEGKIINKQPQS